MHTADTTERPVRLFVLGGLRVERDGAAIADTTWKRRSAQMLVKLLALAPGHQLHREQVIDLLWPGSDPHAAANSLYQALHTARRALDGDADRAGSCLRVISDMMILDPERVWIDADHFRAAAEQGLRTDETALLEEALETYGGELLPEDRYEDWVAPARDALSDFHTRVLVRLAEMLEERGQMAEAADRLKQVLEADPTREDLHRRLIRLYAAAGERHRALRQYQICCEALQRELDAEPEEETRRLYNAVLAGRGPGQSTARRKLVILPDPPTPLVGRGQEIMVIQDLYTDVGARLVTLTGPGGVGKTRLAVAAGASLVDTFEDGVVFVSLAALTDARLVASSIATALQVEEGGERSLPDALVAGLANRHLLLILDNFEQVNRAAPLLEHLLARCTALAILVTSRDVLRLAREYDFAIDPLSTPDPTDLPAPGELRTYDAIKLFEQRARAANAGLALNDADLIAIAQICARLDGLPLAIELAAARVRVLPPGVLLGRLQNVLQLLGGGPADAPPRHQTLCDTIRWSYELLDRRGQRLFSILSVFAGTCALEAIEAVSTGVGEAPGEVFEAVTSLVEKSLLHRSADPTSPAPAEARFRMLETIRAYARELLSDSGLEPASRRHHARFYLALAEAAGPELSGPEQAAWLARLERDHDNLRAASQYVLDTSDSESALRFAATLWRFWLARGYLSEGRSWLEQTLAATEDLGADSPSRADVLFGAAALAIRQCDSERAVVLAERSLALARRLGDVRREANALNSLGQVATDLGEYQRAQAFHQQSLALRREAGDVRGIAVSLNNLGDLATTAGEYEQAEELLEESVRLARKAGDLANVAIPLTNLGLLELLRGRHDRAEHWYRQSLDIVRELNHTWGIERTLFGLAEVAHSRGDSSRAVQLYEESLVLTRDIGDKYGTFRALMGLGHIAHAQGDDRRAAEWYEESVNLAHALGNKHDIALALCALGDVRRRQGDIRRAGDLYEESLRLFRETGDVAGAERCLEGLSSAV